MSPFDYEALKFWHSVLNRAVYIIRGRIGLYHRSEDMKSTIIYTNAGSVPVKESLDEVQAIINNSNAAKRADEGGLNK